MAQINRKTTIPIACLFSAFSLLACGDVGIDPPTDRFFNPVALTVDPEGKFLLVANGDFGLSYTSAAVSPVDLTEVGRVLDEEGLRTDGVLTGPPRIIRSALLAGSTVRIGAFAGRMRLDPTGKVAYVSSRQDSTVRALGLERGPDGRLARIDCGGYDEPLQECDDRHRLVGHPAGAPGATLREPFGLDFLPGPPRDAGGAASSLVVAYLRSGDLVLFPLDRATALPLAGGRQEDVLDLKFSSRDVVVHPDGRQAYVTSRRGEDLRVIRLPVCADSDCGCPGGKCPEPPAGVAELCGNGFCELRLGETKLSCPEDCDWKDMGLLATGSSGDDYTDTRALIVSPDGDRLFVARRHVPPGTGPESADLAVLARSYSATGSLRLDLVGVLPLEERPISMAFWPGNGVDRPDLLFAVCYDAGKLVVIDATNLSLLAAVVLGKTPYDLALAPFPDDMLEPTEPNGLGLAYISHFRGDELSVVNINPQSASWLEVVARIRGEEP